MFRLALLAFVTLAAPAVGQTTYTWTGGGANGNWSSAANWGGTPLVSSATNTRLSFAGTANTATTLDSFYGDTFTALGLTIPNGAGGFTVAGGGPTLELGAEGILAANSLQNGLSVPIRLAADQKWRNGSSNRLPISGAVDLGSRRLTLGDTGGFGANSWWVDVSGPVRGTGGVTVLGRASLTGANTYSGGTLIDASSWAVVNTPAALGSGPVEVKGNSTLTFQGAAGDFTLAQRLTYSNTAANDNNGLQVNDPNATLRLAGGLAGAGTINSTGPGKVVVSGANPFAGQFWTGGNGSTDFVVDGTGVGSIAATAFSFYFQQVRVGAGFALQGNPSLVLDQSVVRIESAQSLSGLGVGSAFGGGVGQDQTKLLAPGVTLTLRNGVSTAFGTIQANLAGDWTGTGEFYKAGIYANNSNTADTSTTTVSGVSTFVVGRVYVEGGVLSFDTIGPAGTASAVGAGGAFRVGSMSFGYRTPTLQYTGPTATTDRPLELNGSEGFNAPARVEVTNPATILTWSGPVSGVGNLFQKTGPGTLVISGTANTYIAPVTVLDGRLDVTGRLNAPITVAARGTLGGKRVGGNAVNLGGTVTVQGGGTLRAGTGSSGDVFGVGNHVTLQPAAGFAATVDGGATPRASKLEVNPGSASDFTLRLQGTAANPLRLALDKGDGPAFAVGSPVTLEIARVFPPATGGSNRIWSGAGSSPFAYNPAEWVVTANGFDIDPASVSLFTTGNGNVLNVRFTPVPEPAGLLGVAAVVGVMGRRAKAHPSRRVGFRR